MTKPRITIAFAIILLSVHGIARGELITEFDPADTPAYWVSDHYAGEAVLFDVGEDSVQLSEIWLHYDVPDSVGLYVIKSLPDTTPPSLIHRVGNLKIPVNFVDSWMPVNVRDADLTVSGEFWILVRNLFLVSPPGMSLRGHDDPPVTSYTDVEPGDWAYAGANLGIGVLINEPTGIDDEKPSLRLPRTSLRQNYPNPFNPATTISFDIGGSGDPAQPVSLVIYDVRGRRVRTLLDSRLETGRYRLAWDGTDARGMTVPSGVYFYTLKTPLGLVTRKMVVQK